MVTSGGTGEQVIFTIVFKQLINWINQATLSIQSTESIQST